MAWNYNAIKPPLVISPSNTLFQIVKAQGLKPGSSSKFPGIKSEDYSSYLLPHIPACKGGHSCFRLRQVLRDRRRYGLWQGPGKCVFKLGSPFARIKEMPHCFLVNHSVFFIPREDKALPSIQILFTELRSHLLSRPARDDKQYFFVFISVVTVSAYHD